MADATSLLLRLFVCFLLATPAAAQTISTIAGNPTRSNVPATELAAVFARAVTTDANGVLYAATGTVVYRFSGGTATRVAGTSIQGPTVLGAQALATRFTQIGAIAVAANGDLFIADEAQDRIFRVRAGDGVVELFAGGGNQQGVSNVPATNLQIGFPSALGIDSSGRVYIGNSSRVYRVDPATGQATHIAGNGTADTIGEGVPATSAAVNPSDLAVDAAQNIYLAEGATIRRVTPAGIISTFAGTGTVGSTGNGGLALSAQVNAVRLAVGGNQLFFAEPFRVRAIDLTSTIVSPVAGTGVSGFTGENGPALTAQIGFTISLAASTSGDIFMGESPRVRRVSGGIINTVAFNGALVSGLGGPALAAQIGLPKFLTRDGAGNLFFATNDQVFRVAANGTFTLIAGNGSGGGASGDNGQATAATLASIGGIAVDPAGANLYISQSFSAHRIRRVALGTGIITNFAGTGARGFTGDNGAALHATLDSPAGLLVHAGFLYVADRGNSRIRRIELATNQITRFAGNGNAHEVDGPPLTTGIGSVETLDADTFGRIYFADFTRLRRVATTPVPGMIQSLAGNGAFGVPAEGGNALAQPLGGLTGIAVHALTNGSLDPHPEIVYLSDASNNRVWEFNETTGTVRTLAGNGAIVQIGNSQFSDFSGDGGPAGLATLNEPGGLVFDGSRLVIADSLNFRIRRVDGLENVPPILDPVGNRTVPEDTVTQITIDFADSTTSPAALMVTAASSNPNVVAQSGLAIGPLLPNPTGGSRVLTITPRPNAVGIALITLTLVDTDGGVTRGSFSFTTTAVNDPPTIEPIANITAGDAAPFSTPVIVSEIDGPMFSLTATSSNQALLPNANLVFSGFGLSRTLTMTPIAGLGGTTTVTVTVSDGLTSASRSFVATVVVAPQPPVLTSAVIDGAVAELEWAAATGGITPLAYQIEAGTASGASSVVESITARARRFALTLPENGTWFVRIRAVNGVALSPPSAEATLNVTGVSGRPRNLTAIIIGNLVTFRWTLPTNGTRTGYRLDVGTASGLSNLQPLSVPPTFTGLTVVASGTSFVRLVALNGVGASTPSNEIRLVVGGQPGPPAAPTDVQVGVDGTTAVFHWQSPATGGAPLQFVLDAGANTPGQFNLVTGIPFGSGFTLAASAPPGTYNVQLRALNAGGSSPGSSELFVTLPSAAFLPSPPALLRANVEPSRLVTLAWTPPFAGVATSYLLEAGTGPGLANLVVFPIGPTPSFQVGAPPGTYFVRVRAVNSAGISGVSNEIVVVVP